MTSAVLGRRAAGPARGYGFRAVARMEWEKLRTVRSTWFIVVLYAASLIGLAVLALSLEGYARMSAADRAAFDPTHDCFIGLVLGQLLVGVLGVLAITAEFSSGMIRATFAAAPNRALVLAAKAAVLGAVTLAAGEVSAFAAFLAGLAALTPSAPHPALGQPGVLISLGLGALIRHTAGAVGTVVGVLFVLPLLFAPFGPAIQNAAQNFLPHPMAAASLTAVKPVAGAWPSGVTFCLLCGYAAAALAAGAWALTRRDA